MASRDKGTYRLSCPWGGGGGGGVLVICMRLDYIPVGVGNYLTFYVVLFGGDYLP